MAVTIVAPFRYGTHSLELNFPHVPDPPLKRRLSGGICLEAVGTALGVGRCGGLKSRGQTLVGARTPSATGGALGNPTVSGTALGAATPLADQNGRLCRFLEKDHDALAVLLKARVPALKLGLISLVAGVLAMGTPLAAVAAVSGGVKITLTCGTLPAGSGAFMVTANRTGSVVTVPCGSSATATNPAWTAGTTASISVVAQPVGTLLAVPFTSRASLTAGVVNVSMAAVPIPSGGLRITLNCSTGIAGTGTLTVTANERSSVTTIPCGGSATVTNPAWTAWITATIEATGVPKGTHLGAFPPVPLTTGVVAVSMSLVPCPMGRSVPAGCPQPDLRPAFLRLAAAYLVLLLIAVLLVFIVIIPFEFWIIRGWIRYFSRKEDPREVIEDLSARPGLGWWVRRYVGWVLLKHKLFKVSLPLGFDDDKAG